MTTYFESVLFLFNSIAIVFDITGVHFLTFCATSIYFTFKSLTLH